MKTLFIYDNAEEYAKQTFTTLEQAKIRCDHYKKLQEQQHQAKKCPKCGQHTLEFETGCYEEGYGDYIYCENEKVEKVIDEDGEEFYKECDFTSKVTKNFEPIHHWWDFDEVLAFSIDIERDGKEEIEKQIGCTWTQFVENANKELIA